jgi:anti-sigma factor RsiW
MFMDCKRFREILDLYVDGELPADGMAGAGAHIGQCPACRRTRDEMLRLRQALKQVVSVEPPASLVQQVRRIPLPFWRRVLLSRDSGDGRLWSGRISVPIPLFAVTVAALCLLSFFSIYRLVENRGARVAFKQGEEFRPPTEGANLERFDHGERAMIYKVKQNSLGNSR